MFGCLSLPAIRHTPVNFDIRFFRSVRCRSGRLWLVATRHVHSLRDQGRKQASATQHNADRVQGDQQKNKSQARNHLVSSDKDVECRAKESEQHQSERNLQSVSSSDAEHETVITKPFPVRHSAAFNRIQRKRSEPLH